jgi:hypothetical protein
MSTAQLSDLFRAVNDRIVELGVPPSGVADLVCECGDERCVRVMRMDVADYVALRAEPTLRAVIPGHEKPEQEVVRRSDGFVVLRATVDGRVTE